MKKLKAFRKILSFVTCSVLSAAVVAVYPALSDKGVKDVSAKTIAEIQEERQANQDKIAEYESQMSDLEGSKNYEEAVQDNLKEQIELMRENLALLNSELDKISEDISTAEANIEELDRTIADQQQQIDDNVELFKERLCAMYVSGNENLAAVVLGSSSFYDIISRVEMANRMASYDEELINGILDDIDELEQSKKDMEQEKLTLEMKLQDQEARKKEKTEELALYSEKMLQTQDEIDRLKREQEMLQGNMAELQDYITSLDAQEAEIQAEIKRKQEEAQKAYEEEQRRIAEEEARKLQEEAERIAAEKEKAQREAEEASRAAEEASIAASIAAEEEASRIAAEEEASRAAAEEASRQAEEASSTTTTTDPDGEEETTEATSEEEEEETTEYEEETTEAYTEEFVAPEPSGSGFMWPAPGFAYISSGYGYRWGTNHNGIDIGDAGISGGAAVASKSGIVIDVSNSCEHNYPKSSNCCGNGYGNYVVISHDGVYSTLYGHLAYTTVSVGDYVSQGQQIGVIGSTGFSTGAHLHFEVRVNGVAYDPLGYVSP